MYEIAQKRLKEDPATARAALMDVWERAPFFRDPAGIAPDLALKAPMSYEEDKERRLAGEAKARKEEEVGRSTADAAARLRAEAQRR
jgi:hypothetical protein